MALEKSTLSRNSGRLVERGWVEIREHPEGRGVLLALTARGNQLLLQALPAWQQAQKQAQSLVSEALLDLQAGKDGVVMS
jgi:DNA-binding MarR family transcriptional regulator